MKIKEKMIVRRSDKVSLIIKKTVMHILEGWSGKLTWSLLIDAVAKKTYQHYTRQALGNHREIAGAFKLTKERLSAHRVGARVLHSPQDVIESQRHQALRAENDRLKAEIEYLQEMFNRWAFNAFANGVTKEMLDQPLQKVRR